MRKVCGVLCAVSLLCALGFVGGMETGGSMTVGVIGCTVSLAGFAIFAYLAGLFQR